MYKPKHAHIRQLVALLLMTVMVLVHVTKALHTHPSSDRVHSCQQENTLSKAHGVDTLCDICAFQLAKDTPFTGQVLLVIAPVHSSPTYSRLLTAINPDRLFVVDSRGPPQV